MQTLKERKLNAVIELYQRMCKALEIDTEYLRESDRRQDRVMLRKAFAYWADRIVPQSPFAIAAALNKDRTTIIHYLQSVRDYLDTSDQEYLYVHNKIMNALFASRSTMTVIPCYDTKIRKFKTLSNY